MAKVKAEKDIGEKTKESVKLKPDGSEHRPFPWCDPFPESKLADDGKTETVFVRATAKQDIFVNGIKKPMGDVVLPCDFAHQHASALSAPVAK